MNTKGAKRGLKWAEVEGNPCSESRQLKGQPQIFLNQDELKIWFVSHLCKTKNHPKERPDGTELSLPWSPGQAGTSCL